MRRVVQETIRICREKDVLDAYLANEEAAVIMFEIGDQEKALAMAMEREGREAERLLKEALASVSENA